MTDIKRLPSMQMEKMGVCNQYGMGCCDGRNALRKQILSELTKKPTVTKPKTGKGDVTRCNTDITKPKDRLKELKKEPPREFYELMQYYRHMPLVEQEKVVKAYKAVWKWITTNFKPKESQ